MEIATLLASRGAAEQDLPLGLGAILVLAGVASLIIYLGSVALIRLRQRRMQDGQPKFSLKE